jgi:hypothetical protein
MNRVVACVEAKEFNYIDIEKEDIIAFVEQRCCRPGYFGLEHYKIDYLGTFM